MSEEIKPTDEVKIEEKPVVADIITTPDKDGKDPIAALRKNFLGLAKPREVVTEKPAKVPAKPFTRTEVKPAEKVEEKKEETEVKPEPKEPKEEPEEKKAPKVKRVAQPVAEIKGASELAETAKALRETAEAMTRQKAEPEKKPSARALPPEIEKKLPDLRALAEAKPDQFKDIEERAREFYGKGGIMDSYKAQWKKANPGRQFSEDDEEHADFFSENEPFVSNEDLEFANEYRTEKRIKEAVEKQTEPVRREIQLREAKKAAVPVVQQFNTDLIKTAAAIVNPDLGKVEHEKWMEADPLAVKVMNRVHGKFTDMATALGEWKAGVPFDPKNSAHVAAAKVSNELAAALADADPDAVTLQVTDNSGKVIGTQRYVPPEEYAKASEAKRRGMWTITEEVVMSRLAHEFAQEVKSYYDEFKPIVGASPAKAGVQQDAQQEKQAAKPQSPSIGSSAPAPVPDSVKAQSKSNVGPNFLKGFLGG